jgi:hypothetical protein
MNRKIIEEYQTYTNKIGNRKALYKTVADKYNIKTAVYPGSHIDITPSLVIPKVTYIDNFKGAIKFFKDIESIKEYLEQKKDYSAPCGINFLGQDYNEPLDIEKVDLIISQYAGFVGQATKDSLKVGGILLCNDSHGDASLAKRDEDFKLIGIVDGKNRIQNKTLEQYFKLSNGKVVNINKVKEKMKGLKYKVMAENYLFQKVK